MSPHPPPPTTPMRALGSSDPNALLALPGLRAVKGKGKGRLPRAPIVSLQPSLHDIEDALPILTCLANEGFVGRQDILPTLELVSRAFRGDVQLWRAWKDTPGPGGRTALMYNCMVGDTLRVHFLLHCGANVNAASSNGFTPLMWACTGGHEGVIKLLFTVCPTSPNLLTRRKAVDVDAALPDGTTPLMSACTRGHLGAVKLLTAHGANLECTTTMNAYTALICSANQREGGGGGSKASRASQVAVVSHLCAVGCNVNFMSPKDGLTALACASKHGNTKVVEVLLKEGGADPNLALPEEALSPLMLAAQHNHVGVIKALCGVLPPAPPRVGGARRPANYHDEDGMSVISEPSSPKAGEEGQSGSASSASSSSSGSSSSSASSAFNIPPPPPPPATPTPIIRLKANPDAHMAGVLGYTALMVAVMSGSLDAVCTLIHECGASPSLGTPGDNLTPMQLAAKYGHLSIARVLVGKGAPVHTATLGNGMTPLMNAARRGHTSMVAYLCDNGGGAAPLVNARMVGVDDGTALVWAAKGGHTECVEVLCGRGGDVNAISGPQGLSPLHLALYSFHFATALLLIEKGADVNAKAPNGMTPLMVAAYRGSARVIKALLSKGALVNDVKPNDGSSALMLATMRGNLKAIKELTAGGADVNAKRLDTGHTVLMCALLSPFASHNSFDERFNIVEHLVRSGADREAVCNAGNSARMVAERVYRRNAFLRRVMVCMLEGDKEEAQEVLVGAAGAGAAGAAGAAGDGAGVGAGGAAAIEEEADDEEAEDEDGEEAEEDLMQ